jgi:hypothetical protein
MLRCSAASLLKSLRVCSGFDLDFISQKLASIARLNLINNSLSLLDCKGLLYVAEALV